MAVARLREIIDVHPVVVRKKRKIEDERRRFRPEWEEEYVFIPWNEKPLCLLCNVSLSHFKRCNLKRHHQSRHKDFMLEFPPNTELRTNKIALLKSNLDVDALSSFVSERDLTCEAGLIMAWNIVRDKRPYTDVQFIKKNMADVLEVIAPDHIEVRIKMDNLRTTFDDVQGSISKISTELVRLAKKDIQQCQAFSLALRECTDIENDPQLAVFICYTSSNVQVREELLYFHPFRKDSFGIEIKNALDVMLTKYNVPLNKLVGIVTNDTPVMVKKCGLLSLMKADPSFPEFIALQFDDFQTLKTFFSFLVDPFNSKAFEDQYTSIPFVIKNSEKLEREVQTFKEDSVLKEVHNNQPNLAFWKSLPSERYPELKRTVICIISIFSTTYCCDSLSSILKMSKLTYKADITNKSLAELIRTSLTTYQPNFQKLATTNKTIFIKTLDEDGDSDKVENDEMESYSEIAEQIDSIKNEPCDQTLGQSDNTKIESDN